MVSELRFIVAEADALAVLGVLPESARQLAEVVGLPLTLELMRALGGRPTFVRLKMHAGSPLAAVVGPEAAQALHERFGGSFLEVPRLVAVERMLRDNAIRADFDAGATPNELAARYGVTARRIRATLTASPCTAPRRLAFSLALEEMQRLADARTVARWLRQLGHQQAASDMERRDAVTLAARLLREGQSRPEVRGRLMARGHSRRSAYRVIDAALCQLRPPLGTHGQQDAGIETRPPAP
jgi:hypothetical protein